MDKEPEKNYWDQTDDSVTPEAKSKAPNDDVSDNPPLNWTAAEYVHLNKGVWWFVLFWLVAASLVALDILFLHDWTFSVLVVVMAVATMIYVRRPPRELSYSLSADQGLYVVDKLYSYSEFKSFGIIRDGKHVSILLVPTKRFSPGVSVYFPEELGEKIVDMLGSQLPMQNIKLDILDVMIRRLRL